MPPLRVLGWTETYWVGGADRFLADLSTALDPGEARLRLAGNAHPAFDTWLEDRAPDLLPRVVVPVASLVSSPLARLRDRLAAARAVDEGAGAGAASSASEPERAAPIALAVAALRYRQAAANYVRIRRLLERVRPDVLHINNGGYPGAESCRVAALAAKHAGVPRVVHFVHNMAYPPIPPVAVERAFDRRVDAATDVWVTAAHRASDQLRDVRHLRRTVRTVHYGLPAPVAEAPPPAAAQDLGFRSPGLRIAVVANLEARKGHRTLFEALHRLRNKGVPVYAACVGEGAERAALQSLLTTLDLHDSVRLLGWRQDVPAVLQAADVLCLPSLANECLPYAVLEAMQAGLPVISTDVAGIPEMVADRVTGRVVAPGDAQQLADALEEVTRDPDCLTRWASAGRARVAEHFSVARMTSEMTALWSGR